jgi:hypothetical protein
MSVFRVNLDQGVGRTAGGYLDPSKSGGYSIQRTIYAPGPNKINRKLVDGSTFTDVNYWKRFSSSVLAPEQAFIEVVTDDGSVWSDYSADNSFPRSYHVIIADNSAYAANVVDILGDNGSAAVFTQITVTASGSAPTFRFNGLSTATLTIAGGVTQVFDKGDLVISKIEINNTQSSHAAATADIFVSIKSVANS